MFPKWHYCFSQKQFNSSHEEYKDFCLVDEPGLKILDSRRLPVNLISGLFTKNPEQFYFVARQSKSRRIFLFDAKALADSNANLVSKFGLIVESLISSTKALLIIMKQPKREIEGRL